MERYAESLGLPGTPKIKILNREEAKKKLNAANSTHDTEEVNDEGSGSSDESEADEPEEEVPQAAPQSEPQLPDPGEKSTKVVINQFYTGYIFIP